MIPDIYPQEKPQAILFDWDNTLVDSWRVVLDSINVAFTHLNRPPMTENEFWSRPHHSMKNMARELFGDNWQEPLEIYYKAVKDCHLHNLQELEGAAQLLDTLTRQDIYLAVVSNKHGDLLRKEASHLGWDQHFGAILGSHDTAEDKPSPIPVIEALKPAQLDTGHHIWFVGDSTVDVQCAKNSGCVPIVVGHANAANENDIVHAKDCLGLRELIDRI